MSNNIIGKSADFFIKVVMLFTTFVSLLYFAPIYNAFLFTSLAILLMISIIIKGVFNAIEARNR